MVIAAAHYELFTLAVAIVGLVLSSLALGWQALSFIYSGSRVKTRILYGLMGPGALVVNEHPMPVTRQMADAGYTTQVLAVEVRNIGRLAVSVNSVLAQLETGEAFGQTQYPPDRKIPYRLEAQHQQTWYVDMDLVRTMARAADPSVTGVRAKRTGSSWIGRRTLRRHPQSVHMRVGLGNGKTVKTPSLPIPALEARISD